MNTDLESRKDVNELVIKVLSNRATEDECVRLYSWVKESDDNRRLFLHLRNTWLAASQIADPESVNISKAMQNINRRINSSLRGVEASPGDTIHPAKTFSFIKALKIAALWILIFGLGSVFSVLVIRPARFLNLTADASVVTPRGSKAMTSLPDGTVVWMNAGSKIEYKIPAGKSVREVRIEGEAYFDVAKDADHPFTVHAGGIIIKAYGTEFNVKAYPEDKVVETTLVEGSVSVEMKNRPSGMVMLKPNEQVSYFRETPGRSENFLVTKGIDPSRYTLWIKDKLQINGEKLEDLAVILGRKYDVTIYFEDDRLKELRFTGIIENETIEQILELIKIASDVDYRIEGREVWLSHAVK